MTEKIADGENNCPHCGGKHSYHPCEKDPLYSSMIKSTTDTSSHLKLFNQIMNPDARPPKPEDQPEEPVALTGWICPRCGAGNSPTNITCPCHQSTIK